MESDPDRESLSSAVVKAEPHLPIPPHSCKHCERIVLRQEHFNQLPSRVELPHTISEIRQAIEERCGFFMVLVSYTGPHHLVFCSGCPLCTRPQEWRMDKLAMLKRLFGHARTEDESEGEAADDSYRWTKQACKFKLKTLWKRGRVSLRLYTTGYRECFLEWSYHGWLEPMEIPIPPQIVVGVEGKSASELGANIYRSFNAEVASQASLRQISQWLEECHSSHDLCRQDRSSFVPQRLLHIELGTEIVTVRLVENWEELQIKWAALSYVWGGDQKLKTTVSTIADMKAGIEMERLPQTLQDAITVCRALGLEFLWVDALCIVQDDPEDLKRELASMPQIYQRAWVTISASTAARVTDGFLLKRCYSHRTTPVSLPYLEDDGLDTERVILVGTSSEVCSFHDDPINERAWAYQERRLSPRMLDFNHKQVILYCHTHKLCQGDGSITGWSTKHDSEIKLATHIQERIHYKPISRFHGSINWHDMVNGYVTRKLSFPPDKLTALSALASLYRERTGYTYLAGLWKESLINDLCWGTDRNKLFPRPKQYRAPSWSWAAIDVVASPDFPGNLVRRNIYFGSVGMKAQPQAKVTNVTIRQEPPNTTYGKIYAGLLTLEAPVLWTKLRCWGESGYRSTSVYTKLGIHDAPFEADTKDDGQFEDIGTAGLTVLTVLLRRSVFECDIVGFEGGTAVFYEGLILVETVDGMYRRIGLFRCSNSEGDIEDGGDRFRALFQTQTITIV